MKKISAFFIALFLAAQIFTVKCNAATTKFGVFVGLESSQISKLITYDEVVIDAAYYSKAQITYLHNNGVKVYSYLNMGSIEEFRSYYDKFSGITLGSYDNWADEKWVNVGNLTWRNYVVNTMAKNLKAKGVDGFFIDNVDVYSEFPKSTVYNGLVDMLKRLKTTYNSPVIVNGGYDFFTKAMKNGVNLKTLADGVNTESVYTSIDFDANKFTVNSAEERGYAVQYLKVLQKKGLKIYITEYSKSSTVNQKIKVFYSTLNFTYYIANNLDLQ